MRNNLIDKLKGSMRLILFATRKRYLNRNSDWIMGRVACMGSDVLKISQNNTPIINIQKGRIDYLNRINENRVRSNRVIPFIERDDIKNLIFQQQIGYGIKMKDPLMLYIDSYSELTDQMFTNKQTKRSFYANYSDVSHSPEFKKRFDANGLLELDNLFDQYYLYFSSFRKKIQKCPNCILTFSS